MKREDYYKISSILAFAVIVAAYLMSASSISAMNKMAEDCNEKLNKASHNYAICQACLAKANVSDILKEVETNGTEEEESS